MSGGCAPRAVGRRVAYNGAEKLALVGCLSWPLCDSLDESDLRVIVGPTIEHAPVLMVSLQSVSGIPGCGVSTTLAPRPRKMQSALFFPMMNKTEKAAECSGE